MYNVNHLKKVKDLIAGGQLQLSLYEPKINLTKRNLFLGTLAPKGLKGLLLFRVTKHLLESYLSSKTTLNETYRSSPDPVVQLKNGRNITSYVKIEFLNQLPLGDQYYRQIDEKLKP